LPRLLLVADPCATASILAALLKCCIPYRVIGRSHRVGIGGLFNRQSYFEDGTG